VAPKEKQRARLAEAPGDAIRDVDLLSATPHDGKPESFASL